MSLCNILWAKNKALPFQFIVVGAGISTFVSPFLAQPFINDVSLPPHPHPPPSHGHSSSSSSSSSTSFASSSQPSCPENPYHFNGTMNLTVGTVPSQAIYNSIHNADIKWPFIIVGIVTLPAAAAFFYFYCTQPRWQEPLLEEDISPSDEPNPELLKPLLTKPIKTFSKKSRSAALFRVLVILLNLPVFGLLLTYADLLTSVGMASPLCMTAVQASYFNTVLWGAAMIGRAVSAGILLCVPMYLQLLLGSVGLVVVGVVLVVFSYTHSVVLWFGTAGVALFLTPSMPGFIAWSGDYLPITPFFMNLCLCSAGVGEMVFPFLAGQLMAGYGTWYMMLFCLVIMVAMLVLFVLASYVARRLKV